MRKKEKQRNFTILIISILLIIILLGTLLLTAGSDNDDTKTSKKIVRHEDVITEENDTTPENTTSGNSAQAAENVFQPIYTSAGIVIEEVKSYAGKYLEDGSDEIVSNVMALQVKNETEESIQLADMSVADAEGNNYEFRITTLLPGQEMLILENNRVAYDETTEIVSAEITSLALFSEEPDLHENLFDIQTADNLITIKNISEETISAARVCYKNISGDIYIGGITYTVSIPELAPGESVDLPTRHFTEDASEVVFVTYAR